MSLLDVFKNKISKFQASFLYVSDNISNVGVTRREKWLKTKAKKIKNNALVLDAGAGQCPYRHLFGHCQYKTQDFTQYRGTKRGTQVEKWKYGDIDYVCDIVDIPINDNTYDVVICTEVLEHVPFPDKTIESLARILKKDGKLLITAPLASGLHQEPFHYYGGFTPHFYRKMFSLYGLKLDEIKSEGGLFAHTAQEMHRSAFELAKREKWSLCKRYLFEKILPKYYYSMDIKYPINEFTIGYMIQGTKI